jgi:hypothetical protein
MGWISDSLGLDYLRVLECRCKGRSYALILDTEIGNEDASAWDLPKRHEIDDEDTSTSKLSEIDDEDADSSNRSDRREASMSVTHTLRRRFLKVGPEDPAKTCKAPKTPLRLW